jgi:MFS family permease
MKLGRNFHKALVASGFANLADGVFQVALPLLAVQLTRSPLLIAGVNLAARLPWLLAVAGALADRLDRRQTMVRVNLVRTVLLAGLALAVLTDLATLPMLYAVALLLGMAETLFDTSAQSLLPAIVAREDLTRANSRLFAVELVANTFVGPPLGGLLAAAGLAVAMGAPAVAYLAGAGCLAFLAGGFRATGAEPAGTTRLRDEIAEGARFVWRHPVLRPLAIMLGVQNMAFAAVFSVFVLFAVEPGPMGLSKAGYGVLLATLGAGSLLGTWLAVPAERRLGRVRTLVLSVVLNAASLVVFVLTTSPVLVGTWLAVSGVAIVLWNVITVSLRQRITPDRLLGRMNAAYRLVGWGTMPIGALLGGVLAEWLGLRPAFLVAALITLATLAGFRWVTEEAVARAEAAGAPTG